MPRSIEFVLDSFYTIVGEPQFQWSAGLALSVGVLLTGLRRPDWAGPCAAIVFCIALWINGEIGESLPAGVLLAWLAAKLAGRRPIWFMGMLGAAAVLAVRTLQLSNALLAAFAMATIVLAASLASQVALRIPEVAWFLLLITATGVFLTVPETDNASSLLAAFLVFVPPALVRRSPKIGPPGIAAMTVLLVWVAVDGGTAREGSILGAVASYGMFIVEPVARALGARLPLLRTVPLARIGTTGIVVTHALIVALASRLAGLQERGRSAAVMLVGVALIGWLAISERAHPTVDRNRGPTVEVEGSSPRDLE